MLRPFHQQCPRQAAGTGSDFDDGAIAEVAANNKINDIYRAIGMQVTGRASLESAGKATNLKLPSFLTKRKRAG